MGYYIFSGLAGAIVAIAIAALARSQFYVLAGLAPLFPTFGLFAHIISYNNGGSAQVKDVALFGIFSIIPYLLYVVTMFFTVSTMRFEIAVLISLFLWCASASVLFIVWNKV